MRWSPMLSPTRRCGARAAAVVTAEDEDQSPGWLVGFRLDAPRWRVVSASAASSRNVALGDGDIAAVSGFRDEERVVSLQGHAYTSIGRRPAESSAPAGDGAILSPMPGKVTSVEVSKGEKVDKGQRLLTLEAMKMEHGLVAPFDGVVAEFNAGPARRCRRMRCWRG